MKLALLLYLTDLLSNLDCTLSIIIALYALFILATAFFCLISADGYPKGMYDQTRGVLKKVGKYWWIYALVILCSVMLPAKRTMYLMLGSAYLSESNLPTKVYQALELKLDDVIRDMKKDK